MYFEGEEYVCSDELYEVELDYLKQKIDAGGDCIITQVTHFLSTPPPPPTSRLLCPSLSHICWHHSSFTITTSSHIG